MDSLFTTINNWKATDQPIALATVLKTWGSSPRGVGAKMVINNLGEMAGSVSGGCVESAVVEAGLNVIRTGTPELLHFGVTDETAWDVGLACGGEIDVYVKLIDLDIFKLLQNAFEEGMSSALSVIVQGPEDLLGKEIYLLGNGQIGGQVSDRFCKKIEPLMRAALDRNSPGSNRLAIEGNIGINIFTDIILPPPTLLIIGGVHIAIPLVSYAKILGYQTIVVDPRRKFGNKLRFGHADRVINAWPDAALSDVNLSPNTAVAILTHDPKIDDPALEVVLRSPVFYVGALGSKKTQKLRKERLISSGIPRLDVQKIKGPIGLNLGSSSPEEIALSIMAEIIREKNIILAT
jgi:xanthine dehydrogenase accessory factor